MLKAFDGNLRAMFNTSGMDYRAMGLKDIIPGLSTDEALKLLASNGQPRPSTLNRSAICSLFAPDLMNATMRSFIV